ncbi:hypothetical protein DRO02_03475 [archaeon]|nr:MAG: hypothetical protein DRO21_05065 [archaeon]RLG64782.1 MAG: hypothetical protein DRO02_03475 [archaeon]RLG66588.1 MAG: hypothetical protein DRN89_00565 [archaeon]HDM23327.1 metallophosphoesterase [Candidatus Bathyarchaeota archaeon]
MFKIIPDERAALVSSKQGKCLVITDLHLGYEIELSKRGIHIPATIDETFNRIARMLENFKCTRLIVNGDFKHSIPVTTWREQVKILALLSSLIDQYGITIDIVPGNHDGNISSILKGVEHVNILSRKGVIVRNSKDRVGILHGHTWPPLFMIEQANVILMGHNHPSISISVKPFGRVSFPCWVFLKVSKRILIEHMQRKFRVTSRMHIRGSLRIVLMPAFSDIVGLYPFNRTPYGKYLSPILNSIPRECLQNSEIYALDGTYLGKLSLLRTRA